MSAVPASPPAQGGAGWGSAGRLAQVRLTLFPSPWEMGHWGAEAESAGKAGGPASAGDEGALQGAAPLPSPDLILGLHRVHGVGFDAITPDTLPAIRPHARKGALDILFLPSHSLAAWAPVCPQP